MSGLRLLQDQESEMVIMIITAPAMPMRYNALVIQVYSEAQDAYVDYKALGMETDKFTENHAAEVLVNISKIHNRNRFRLVRRLISDEVVSYV